jgi:hypothetical protein
MIYRLKKKIAKWLLPKVALWENRLWRIVYQKDLKK